MQKIEPYKCDMIKGKKSIRMAFLKDKIYHLIASDWSMRLSALTAISEPCSQNCLGFSTFSHQSVPLQSELQGRRGKGRQQKGCSAAVALLAV